MWSHAADPTVLEYSQIYITRNTLKAEVRGWCDLSKVSLTDVVLKTTKKTKTVFLRQKDCTLAQSHSG